MCTSVTGPITISAGTGSASVGRLLGVKKWRGRVTKEQLFWLANAPLHRLEPHAAAVYREIERRGRSALIPIDNRQRVLGKGEPEP